MIAQLSQVAYLCQGLFKRIDGSRFDLVFSILALFTLGLSEEIDNLSNTIIQGIIFREIFVL